MSDSFCLSGLSFVAFYLSLERDSLRSTLTHQHRIILLISHLPTDFLLSIYPTLNLMILTLLLRYDLRTVKHRKRTVLVYNSIHLDICKHTCGEGNGTPLQYFAWKIPWTEEPGRLQSMGSLESDTTERLHFHFSLSCIGEGNGNPLQYSCLENPRNGGAWWAAVYGVVQSRTRLKRLSSSSKHTCRYQLDQDREYLYHSRMFSHALLCR